MNILVVTPELPWPPTSGGRAAQYSTLSALCKDHLFRIIYTGNEPDTLVRVKYLEKSLPNVKVLTPNYSSSYLYKSKYLSTHINTFLDVSVRILLTWLINKKTQFFSNTDVQNNLSDKYLNLPKRPYFPFNPMNDKVIIEINKHLEWANILQAEFHDTISSALLVNHQIPTVFICHQSHIGYVESFYKVKSINSITQLPTTFYDLKVTATLETAYLLAFDKIVTFTNKDKNRVLACATSADIVVSPFSLPIDSTVVNPGNLLKWPRKVVFIGAGGWYPNFDAVKWYLSDIQPLLIDLVGIELSHLHVYGQWSKKDMSIILSKNITFHGFVNNLSEEIKGSISIVPIRIGAGLRTKILSSAIAASPIVTTTVGCEGIELIDGQHCLIADDINIFANNIVRLIDSEQLCRTIAISAYEQINGTYSPEIVRDTRNKIYEDLVSL